MSSRERMVSDIEQIIKELQGVADFFMEMYRDAESAELYQRYYDKMVIVSDALSFLLRLEQEKAKTGSWVREPDRVRHWHCSECGHVIGLADLMDNYCPNCGAKMQKWTHSRLMAELGAATYEND